MGDLPRVKVVNPGDGWFGTEYYINDQKIERVKAVDFRAAVDEVPTFTFETMGAPDIDMPGDIRFSFTPQTVTEAIVVLRNELLKHDELFEGFLASIKSGILEGAGVNSPAPTMDLAYDAENSVSYTAEHILKCLIGEE